MVAEQEVYQDQDINWNHIELPTGDVLMKCLTGKLQTQYRMPEESFGQHVSLSRISKTTSGTPFRQLESCSVLQQLDDTGRLVNIEQDTRMLRSSDEIFYSRLEVMCP